MTVIVRAIFLLCLLTLPLKADGYNYAELTTTDGLKYNSVRVLDVHPDSITIMHKNGGCRLKVEQLPLEIQTQLNISLNQEALRYRDARETKKTSAKKAQREAELEEARRRQSAFIAQIVAQQELELSREAKVTVKERHNNGYLCSVAYPVLTDITQSTRSTLGQQKTIVVGKKKSFIPAPELIYLVSERKLAKGRSYEMRILHEEPYSYTQRNGFISHIEMYRVIE